MSLFPEQVDTISNLWTVSNNAQSFLAAPIDNSSPNPVITVVDGSPFPDERTTITIDREIFIVTKASANTFNTELRAAFGSVQLSHVNLATCYGMSIAEYHNDVRDAIIATQTFSANWWRRPVIQSLVTAPVSGLNADDCYLVAGLGGDWSTATINDIACVTAGSPTGWMFITPIDGMIVLNSTTYELMVFDGSTWNVINNGTPLATPNTLMSRDSNADTAIHRLEAEELAVGEQALVRLPGTSVLAHGRFSNTGDAQAINAVLRAGTINATFTEMFLDGSGGSERLVLPDDSTWSFTVQITAHQTSAGIGHAGYTAGGVIYRESGAGTISLVGIPTKQTLAETDKPWNINIEADTTNGSLKITVKGEAGKTIRWVALVTAVEITN